MSEFKKISLVPTNKTFAEIMSNGKSYEVPVFQHDYSWEQDQLDELWQDVVRMTEKKEQHFMGYLVLQSNNDKNYEIIDGQQRITTITLLIIAALNRFSYFVDNGQDKEDNQQRVLHYHNTFLGVFSPATLNEDRKIQLNNNNRDHFNDIIDEPYDVPGKIGMPVTNRLINKGFGFFKKKLEGYNDGNDLVNFIGAITDNLIFTTITVTDNLDAYIVFETLNARGVQLSAPDLLKNYLLSLLGSASTTSAKQDRFEKKWSYIIEQLGEANFTAFLRSHQGLASRLPAKKDMFRVLKDRVIKADQVISYIKELSRYAPVYAALQKPDSSFWTEYGEGKYKSCIENLKTLKLFHIKTPLSLLMAAYNRFPAADFVDVARWIAVISVRYNVICNNAPNEQEIIYNDLANKVTNDKFSISELKKGLIERVYPDDDEFYSAFLKKDMPGQQSSRKILYLLEQIEQHCSGTEIGFSNKISVEHVLPKNPDDDWQEYFGRDSYSEAIDRLGNIALLSAKQNRDIGQQSFAEKAGILKDSAFAINKNISDYAKWDIENLNGHQKWLADQAKTVWRIG